MGDLPQKREKKRQFFANLSFFFNFFYFATLQLYEKHDFKNFLFRSIVKFYLFSKTARKNEIALELAFLYNIKFP
jgi:hypothetical protein